MAGQPIGQESGGRGLADPGADHRDMHLTGADCGGFHQSSRDLVQAVAIALDRTVLVGGGTGEVVSTVGVRGWPASGLVAVLRAYQRLVGRGIGDAGCAHRCQLAPEHRHDLGAEQLDLLERGLHREPDTVYIPQLALVVAEAFTEGHGLVDDLLWTADAHRGVSHVVLEGVRVTVDRGVLEVRPEPCDGVLGASGDERVPAEADDRLLARAMAVVLEPPAVQVDEWLEVEVRCEHVVGEEPVAVVRRLLGDLGGADRAMPYERGYVVEGTRR